MGGEGAACYFFQGAGGFYIRLIAMVTYNT